MDEHEVGYYIGLVTHAKMMRDLIEHFQEHGTDPYQIVDLALQGNDKIYKEAGQKLIDAGYELKNYEVQDDSK